MTTETDSGVQPAIADDLTPVDAPEAVDTAPDADAGSDTAADVTNADDTAAPKKSGAERRIDELTRKRYDAEREAAYWRDLALKATPPAQPEPTSAVPASGPPTLEQFGWDEAKYSAAVIEYAKAEAKAAAMEALREDRQKSQQVTGRAAFEARQAEFAAKVPEYHAKVTDPTLPISSAMAEVIVESDRGPELALYLANNRDQAEVIARLPPVQAARALGRIEARLESPADVPAPAPKPVPVSKAPPPPPRIEATEAAVTPKTTDPASDALSDEEWFKAERKRLARKR